MKKIISVLLAIIMAFSCVVIACAADDEISWDEIKMGGIRCDVNKDKKISAVDALMVLKNVAGIQELTQKQTLRADANNDGKVSSIDARWILQIAAGLTPG